MIDLQLSNAALNGRVSDSESSEQASSTFSSRSPQSSDATSMPPRAEELDRTLRHTGLRDFAAALEKAAGAVFPNDKKSRYSQVYVLLVSWQSQDPMLPVEREISALRKVLEEDYHYDIDEFQIPDCDSHAEVSEKVNKFVKVGNNSSSHLKIVYYAGHSRLSRTKELLWSTLPTKTNSKCPIVMWSGIQRSLEMANSDVLILLDCCSSGVANASEGNGVTELMCACPFDSKANGVGHYSFTQALTTELRFLRKKPCFSVGELYTSIYTRMQSFLPQGIENERYPPPVHFVLTHDEPFTRGIKLSIQDSIRLENKGTERGYLKRNHFQSKDSGTRPRESKSPDTPNKRLCLDEAPSSRIETIIQPWLESSQADKDFDNFSTVTRHSQEGDTCQTPEGKQAAKSAEEGSERHASKDSMYPFDAPRALFAIRFREDIKGEDLDVGLFKEWLRSAPAAVEEVRVEAGFRCFSTLLLVTMPLSMCSYMPQHPAIYPLGAVKSSIILPSNQPTENPSRNKNWMKTSSTAGGPSGKRKRVSFAIAKHEETSKDNILSSNDEYDRNTEDFSGFKRQEQQLVCYPDQRTTETIQGAPIFEVSEPATIYIRNIFDKFPMADPELVRRLGEANWQRHVKIRNQNQASSTLLKASGAKSVFHDSALGGSIPSLPSGSCYAPSASSFVTRAGDVDGDFFKVPPTPKEVVDGEPFKCFICGRLMTHIKNRVDWKIHVFRDMRPYICTVSSCKDALCTFASRKEWADHEFSQHWKHSLIDVGHNKFNIQQDPYNANLSATSNQNAIKNTSTPISGSDIFTCPLCKTSLPSSMKKYVFHVAKHMESIALATLPPGPEENSDNDSDESVHGGMDVSKLSPQQTHEDVFEPIEENDFLNSLSTPQQIWDSTSGPNLSDMIESQDSTPMNMPIPSINRTHSEAEKYSEIERPSRPLIDTYIPSYVAETSTRRSDAAVPTVDMGGAQFTPARSIERSRTHSAWSMLQHDSELEGVPERRQYLEDPSEFISRNYGTAIMPVRSTSPPMAIPSKQNSDLMTSSSTYNESPAYDPYHVPPFFGNNDDLDHDLAGLSGNPWYSIFPQDKNSDSQQQVGAPPVLPEEELEDAESLRSTGKSRQRPGTRTTAPHLPLSSVNSRKRNKPLPPIIVEDPNNTVAIKRARDTLAARKSRQRKMQRLEELELAVSAGRGDLRTGSSPGHHHKSSHQSMAGSRQIDASLRDLLGEEKDSSIN